MPDKNYNSPFLCGAYGPQGARCWLARGHADGPDGTRHEGQIRWSEDDAPTLQLPPMRERILPPLPPTVRDLKGAELLLALAEELQREAQESGE